MISSQPNSWQSRLLLAAEYHRSKRAAEAKILYLQVLEEQPNQPDALHLLGALAGEAGDFQQAVDLIQRAIIHGPNISNFHNDLGVYFHRWKKLDQAEASLLQAIRLDAKNVDAQFNLGLVLRKLGRFREAKEAFSQVILLKPDFADAHRRLGAAYVDLGQIDLALTHLRRAVHVQHDYVDGHMSLGVLLLLLGNFTEGWPEYEWRLRKDSAVPGPQYTHPTWQGQDLGGRTILLRAEQGIGDTIYFVRYAPLVAARGGKVILACQRELKRLLARLPGVDKTVGQHDFIDGFDVQCPLPSLPPIFGTDLRSIPPPMPIQAERELAQTWAAKVAAFGPGLRVGLNWAGNPNFDEDDARSMSLRQMGELLCVQGVRFFSLQKNDAAEQLRQAPELGLVDFADELLDVADTAALIANLDLVITVDTAVAHLAGSMGKPVWVLLRSNGDWRWLLGRADSPWYPTMRLFRQPAPRQWAPVIATAARELQTMAADVRTRR